MMNETDFLIAKIASEQMKPIHEVVKMLIEGLRGGVAEFEGRETVCPTCKSRSSLVTSTVISESKLVLRRHQCKKCFHRFKSLENREEPQIEKMESIKNTDSLVKKSKKGHIKKRKR